MTLKSRIQNALRSFDDRMDASGGKLADLGLYSPELVEFGRRFQISALQLALGDVLVQYRRTGMINRNSKTQWAAAGMYLAASGVIGYSTLWGRTEQQHELRERLAEAPEVDLDIAFDASRVERIGDELHEMLQNAFGPLYAVPQEDVTSDDEDEESRWSFTLATPPTDVDLPSGLLSDFGKDEA